MKFTSICSVIAVVFGLGACSQNNSIKMKGSDTEVNLAVNLAEQFSLQNKEFSIAISGGGSGLGITSLLNGQADIANSSRPLSEEEIKAFSDNNIEIKTIVFAEDATAFVVNESLSIEVIDLELLTQIINGTITNWNQILPNVNMPINIYGRQSSSGTYSFVKKKLKTEFAPHAKEMTGNAQIIEAIKVDKSGIGYVGAGYISNNMAHGIKVIKIQKDKNDTLAVSPLDKDAIKNRKYYFQRPLYQFVLASSWHKVAPFIEFEKSSAGKKLIEAVGYYILD